MICIGCAHMQTTLVENCSYDFSGSELVHLNSTNLSYYMSITFMPYDKQQWYHKV